MSLLAPTLQSFFTQWLVGQRRVSQHTVAAYRDTFRLLLAFAQQATGRAPSQLDWDDLDAPLITSFLEQLETKRHNSTRTRNARLAAVHSLFRFAALRHPEHAALIQRVLAIPQKRGERNLVTFLEPPEVAALLAAPNRDRRVGRRDHAMLVLAIQTGLRVSELISLNCQDARLGTGAHVRCRGKGRKERVTPLTDLTVACCGPGWLRRRDNRQHLFSLAPAANRSPVTPSPSSCPSMLGPQVLAARPWRTRRSLHTCCATPAPCNSCAPEWTFRPSHSGLATKVRRPHRSTCTPTSRSKNGPWRGLPLPTHP